LIDIAIVGDDRVLSRLHNAHRIIQEEILKASLDSAALLEATSKDLAPKRTGNLARSIAYRPRILPGRTEVVATVSSAAPYARYVNEGTGIYHVPDAHAPFTAKRHRFMHWVDGQGGSHYARVVRGMRPRPFIDPSVALNHEHIIERYQQIGPRVAARLSG
jgi:HK97 gp10 family phage protein